MKAVILAAGEGSRMRPLTHTVPKPLTEVAGKPILTWIMESVKPHVDGIVLIVGHLREKIMAHYGDHWEGLPVTYIHQAEQRGTGHALQMCKSALEGVDRFFVVYGDNITAPQDVARCAEHPLSAMATHVPDPEKYGIFKMDESRNLIDMVEKPKEFIGDLANAGVYVFDSRIWDLLANLQESERGELELTDAVLGLAHLDPMRVVDVRGYWLPIGYRDDVAKAEHVLLGHDRGWAEWTAQRRRTILAVLSVWRERLREQLGRTDSNTANEPAIEGRKSVAEIGRHLIVAERRIRRAVETGVFQQAETEVAEAPDLPSLQRLLEEERQITTQLIQQLDGQSLDRTVPVTATSGERLFLTVEELLLTLPAHEAWHTGQISWANLTQQGE